ncbi:MAG: hypothetical protein HQ546_08890 [Planctomycetes bacterium]|nr:hypothetical protein [Planctomycetota bacterium]
MTYPTGQSRASSRNASMGGPSRPRLQQAPPPAIDEPAGFTLVELILVLTLLVAITAVSVFGFAGWQRSSALNEGADRFATLLRMLPLTSANCGRRLQLTFADDENPLGREGAATFSVQWENDPLGAPGQFVNYAGGAWEGLMPAGLIHATASRLTGTSAYRLMPSQASAQGQILAPITFCPDASCDSAVVYLVSVNESDTRVAVIELNGLTRIVKKRILTADEFKDSKPEYD